jgi:hypothetical protein
MTTSTRTLSKPSVLKRLREANFDMAAIKEQGRGQIEIGYITEGRATWEQRMSNYDLANQASEILGWGWFATGYGCCVLKADMGCAVTRELISNNMD